MALALLYAIEVFSFITYIGGFGIHTGTAPMSNGTCFEIDESTHHSLKFLLKNRQEGKDYSEFVDDTKTEWQAYKWFAEHNVHFGLTSQTESEHLGKMQGSVIRQHKKGVGHIMKRTLNTWPDLFPHYYLYITDKRMAVLYKLTFG
jgi:hypothetical protein